MTDKFWKFKAYQKWDVLDNDSHPKLVIGALGDCETQVDEIDRTTFTLYGEEESLLLKTDKAPFLRIAVTLYSGILRILGDN